MSKPIYNKKFIMDLVAKTHLSAHDFYYHLSIVERKTLYKMWLAGKSRGVDDAITFIEMGCSRKDASRNDI